MSTKRIVYTRNGTVEVVIPAPRFLSTFASEAEGLAAVVAKSVPPDATNVQIVEADTLPTDRVFREAWTQAGNAIVENVVKARSLRLEEYQRARIERLRELLEQEALGEDITEEKTALVSLDLQVEVAGKTPEQLRTHWPVGLPPRAQLQRQR